MSKFASILHKLIFIHFKNEINTHITMMKKSIAIMAAIAITGAATAANDGGNAMADRKSTRLNSSHA